MRIFDPKNQFGSSLLSSADTQKSSVKLEKQMTVGGGAITLTSTDISDIENWELSNARVEVDGQLVSFLPDTSRGNDGSLTVDFGTYFPNAVLVLKRTVFDGMRQEEEEITIEVEIRQLMAKTLAAAGKAGYDADENIQEWQELGSRAKVTGEDKYRFADIVELTGDEEVEQIVTEPFLSLRNAELKTFATKGVLEWRSDLPALQTQNSPFAGGPLEVFYGKMPNLIDGIVMFQSCEHLRTFSSEMPSLTSAYEMFCGCSGLTSFSSEMPSLTYAYEMFRYCSGLDSWNVALPNSITNAGFMFDGCSGLTSFQSDMPTGLTENADQMFYGCKLDITSVKRIAETIQPCTGTTDYNKTIHLGVSHTCYTDSRLEGYIELMSKDISQGGKGWLVVVEDNGDAV